MVLYLGTLVVPRSFCCINCRSTPELSMKNAYSVEKKKKKRSNNHGAQEVRVRCELTYSNIGPN
jgi:hypothetical protein